MHGINNAWMRILIAVVVYTLLICVSAMAEEGGMIPMNSPVGEIGGRGHWYSLRTMKAADYYKLPPVMSDIKEVDGDYSVSGEPPIELSLVLHPLWGWQSGEPWREAINWVREAEQMFRNSGVPIRFVIKKIQTWDNMPDTARSAYYNVSFSDYIAGADLLVLLKPYFSGDSACGVAGINGRKSVSSCSSKTLAHELGHNFGLRHAHTYGSAGAKGYCQYPYPDAENCSRGTLMSYSGRNRIPLFANKHFEYKNEPLGTEEHDAVEHLNIAKTKKALSNELLDTSDNYVERLTHGSGGTSEAICR